MSSFFEYSMRERGRRKPQKYVAGFSYAKNTAGPPQNIEEAMPTALAAQLSCRDMLEKSTDFRSFF